MFRQIILFHKTYYIVNNQIHYNNFHMYTIYLYLMLLPIPITIHNIIEQFENANICQIYHVFNHLFNYKHIIILLFLFRILIIQFACMFDY